ncbi:hypothetical protein [Paraburkholderia tropica]|uniref:hypothetical protein n=1 Tax=Paraburkholderia tropica TaxID=92647 RepID=UPI00159101F6|nr:hypothetical protein [Paraburkholderia tropica]
MSDTKKDINEIHAEFWRKRKKQTDELLSHLPIAKMAYAVYQSQIKYTPFEQQKPYDVTADFAATLAGEHVEALRSVVNSLNASAPRPKNGPTHKAIVLDAMRLARREDRGLDDFIVGAINGGYPGIEFERLTGRGEVYQIYCDGMVPTGLDENDDQAMAKARAAAIVKRTHKALETWWSEAGRPQKS